MKDRRDGRKEKERDGIMEDGRRERTKGKKDIKYGRMGGREGWKI